VGDPGGLPPQLAHFQHRQGEDPTLILFGEQDRRVPIEQGEQFYTALVQRGIEAQMVRYPREPHGFTEPNHQIDRIQRIADWFDRFLK